MSTESPKMLCSKHGGAGLKLRTYQGDLGEFRVVKNSMDLIFRW